MKILKQLDINDCLFIDIETRNAVRGLEPNTPLYEAWVYKNKFGREPLNAVDIFKSYDEQAALYAEFAAICCITIGKVGKDGILKLKSYVGEDEQKLIHDFCEGLNRIVAANKKTVIVGWAIKGFDVPWIVKRCFVNQIELPNILDLNHLKPWEMTSIVDLMDLWKGGAFNGGSLIAAATALGLANPKDELAGYQTNNAFYNDLDGLAKIETYCCKDVATTAHIFNKLRYEPLLPVEFGEIKLKKVGVLNRVFNKGEMAPAEQDEILKNLNSLPDDEKILANEILETLKVN